MFLYKFLSGTSKIQIKKVFNVKDVTNFKINSRVQRKLNTLRQNQGNLKNKKLKLNERKETQNRMPRKNKLEDSRIRNYTNHEPRKVIYARL